VEPSRNIPIIRISALTNSDLSVLNHFQANDRSSRYVFIAKVYKDLDLLVADLQPENFDLILLHVNLDFLTKWVSDFNFKFIQSKLVVIGSVPDRNLLIELLNGGIRGYIIETVSFDKLLKKIEKIINIGFYLSPIIVISLVDYLIKPRAHSSLTDREVEIVHLLKNGHSYDEIASILKLSIHTVRTHIRNLYKKLDVHSNVEAINKALINTNIP
jgi:DNA-binding NarL/FixJ family response regulator